MPAISSGALPIRDRGTQRLGRAQRLTASKLFAETRAQGERYAGRWLVLCLRRAPDAALRLGVVAGLKIGAAVVRNRAKRRLREVFRRRRAQLRGGCDVILLAKRGIEGVAYGELEADFLTLVRRAGLLEEH